MALYFKRYFINSIYGKSAKVSRKNKKRKKECNIVKLLNPKNDYVFKRIFGQIGNEDITASLISSIVGK